MPLSQPVENHDKGGPEGGPATGWTTFAINNKLNTQDPSLMRFL